MAPDTTQVLTDVSPDPDGRGIKELAEKLKNWIAYDIWGDENAVKVEEEKRRQILLNVQRDSGGELIIENYCDKSLKALNKWP